MMRLKAFKEASVETEKDDTVLEGIKEWRTEESYGDLNDSLKRHSGCVHIEKLSKVHS